ncbi:hypothetical protein [uncultured Amnibacterium sp.]|uniref:hypothetical protein n=1 Tax=uncultured Amnibacterium sp. TaxID=1631851 RepID=UPI0035CC6992
MASDRDVAAIAAELYAAPLGDFTAARTARVRAAREDGDRDLAARVGALPKPSAAAWLIDLLAREHAEDLDRLDDLGSRLRAAQEDGDRTRLRELTTERRTLIAELAGIAADRSEQTGRRASASVLEEVHQTLQAALVDHDAAAAMRSGRLVRSLVAEGLDPVDLSAALAVGDRLGPIAPVGRHARTAAAPPDRDEDAERRKAAEARAEETARAAREARRAAEDAAAEAEHAAAEADRQVEEADDLRAQLERLQQRLDAAEAGRRAAQAAAGTARSAAAAASAAAEDAQRDADDAGDALDRLGAS